MVALVARPERRHLHHSVHRSRSNVQMWQRQQPARLKQAETATHPGRSAARIFDRAQNTCKVGGRCTNRDEGRAQGQGLHARQTRCAHALDSSGDHFRTADARSIHTGKLHRHPAHGRHWEGHTAATAATTRKPRGISGTAKSAWAVLLRTPTHLIVLDANPNVALGMGRDEAADAPVTASLSSRSNGAIVVRLIFLGSAADGCRIPCSNTSSRNHSLTESMLEPHTRWRTREGE